MWKRIVLTAMVAPLGIILIAAIVWEFLDEPNTTNSSRGSGYRNRNGTHRVGAVMLWTATKSYFACAWSAFSYLIFGMPKDKESYWKNRLGFNDAAPELLAAWSAYKKNSDFHHLKDIGVEWTRVWPQRAAKLSALFGCALSIVTALIGVAVGVII